VKFAAVAACLLLLSASGCSHEYYDERGKADAPVSGAHGEDSATEIYNFPDGFGNLATKCVGKGLRGYATTRWRVPDEEDPIYVPANAVIVDDPECAG